MTQIQRSTTRHLHVDGPSPPLPDTDPDNPRTDTGQDNGATGRPESAPAERAEASKPPFYRRPLPRALLGVVLVVGIVLGVIWWLHTRLYESTDDAFVQGHVIPVSPQVSALVKAVHIDDNWRVHRGQLLVELDQRDFQVVVDQKRASAAAAQGRLGQAQTQLTVDKANVVEAQAELAVARTNAENASRDYQRFAALDVRARSQEQLDNATAAQRSTAAQVEQAAAKVKAAESQVADAEQAIKTAQADVQQALADIHQAELNLSYCTITAADDGLISKKSVEPGQYAPAGQPLFSIVPTNVWVVANYKETQLDRIRVGQSVEIDIEAYRDRTFHGKVDSIQNGTGSEFALLPPENATGNYVKIVQRVPVKIVFDPGETEHPGHLLAPGLSVVPRIKVR